MAADSGEGRKRGSGIRPYARAGENEAPTPGVAMPRAPRLYAPEGTVHVAARCNNREFYLTTPEDFATVLEKLRGMVRDYELNLYAYTLMSNHIHLVLRAPRAGTLARPLRWFLTETARAFHRARGRRGHFWERRYRACLVEDDTYGLALLRYLDRNPVRAGLVQDPTTYPWSTCTTYAQGTPNPLVTLHPSYLGLSRDPAGRQRAYTELLAHSADPQTDTRDPRWTTKRAVGTLAFLARYGARRNHSRPATPALRNQ